MKSIMLSLALTALAFADSAAGVRWTVPPGWKSQPARPMRAATYAVPAAHGDQEPAECVVYYFGAGQGGNVEMNVLRWKGQFLGPDGKVSNSSKTAEKTVHGIRITTIEAAGSYIGMGGPTAAQKSTKPGYRLLGAIAEAPGGLIFFKFIGPAKTIQTSETAFGRMIDSLQKQ